MSNNSFTDAYNDDFARNLFTPVKKPTIKVLIYTDDPKEVKTDTATDFGTGILEQLMLSHQPAYARLEVKLEYRNKDEANYGTRKLDTKFLDQYDQVWFFGIHQVNKKTSSLGVPGGGNPESELNNTEVEALCTWMNRGGVLVTGDHANPDPRCPVVPSPPDGMDKFCPEGADHEMFLGLGRALGHRVPRAGELRKWNGPPTRCKEDNYNTQVLVSGNDYEADGLQRDDTPQNIILENFGVEGRPDPAGRPHPLFIDRNGHQITVFPDHMHEGRITIPCEPLCDVWPWRDDVRPRPHVAAYGIDKRNGEKCPVVAVYDGDAVGCGRIVADSTWHHYFNVNLKGFAEGGTVREQLGQYYVNLALWLSPLEKRREMALFMFYRLAMHSLMLENVGSGILNVGKTALHILTREASPCEIDELLLAATPPELRPCGEFLSYPTKSLSLYPLPSKDVILGAVLEEYHWELSKAAANDAEHAGQTRLLAEVLKTGFCRAFRAYINLLLGLSSAAETRLQVLSQTQTQISSEAEAQEE